jgi:hypothetical protein
VLGYEHVECYCENAATEEPWRSELAKRKKKRRALKSRSGLGKLSRFVTARWACPNGIEAAPAARRYREDLPIQVSHESGM